MAAIVLCSRACVAMAVPSTTVITTTPAVSKLLPASMYTSNTVAADRVVHPAKMTLLFPDGVQVKVNGVVGASSR